MNPLPLIDGALWVSGSWLETISQCNRMAGFYKLDARVAADTGIAKAFGTILHKGLEMHYRCSEWAIDLAERRTRVATIFAEEFAKVPTDFDDWRNLNWALEIYDRWVAKSAGDPFQLLRFEKPRRCTKCNGPGCLWCNQIGYSSIMAEVPFAAKLFDYEPYPNNLGPEDINTDSKLEWNNGPIPVYYHGYLDLAGQINGQTWVRDWKSTAKLGPTFWSDKRMSLAQKGYCWGFERTTGIKVAGNIITALRTISPPDYVLQNKPKRGGGEYKTIIQWWNESVCEEKIYLGEGELVEWQENAIALVEEFLWHHSRGFLPKRTTSCVGKYGPCDYIDVCGCFPPSEREGLLASGMFRDKTNERNK